MTQPAEQIHVDLDLIRKYATSGPRYTSYPTAVQFSEFDATTWPELVARSHRRGQPLSLYVHIPFCSVLCYYCACNKVVTRDARRGVRYLAQLDREVELNAPLFQDRLVSQLHLGGGTPTFLDDDQIGALMSRLERSFRFAADVNREFSIEIDPRTVDCGRIHQLRSAGFNRLSMGVQDFEAKVQKAVNRIQSCDATAEVVDAARDAGFRSVSIDLMYGLPHQSLASVARTLEQVVRIHPDRIAIYNYAHLPERFPPQKRIQRADLPTPETRLSILKLCIERLTAAGYVYIGMDHFALPEDELAIALRERTLQRNFQGYSTHAECDMVAFGITAISHVGHTYAQNARTEEEYADLLARGQRPITKGLDIEPEDVLRKDVIMALICHFELDFEALERRYGIVFASHFAEEMKALTGMAEDGLIEIHSDGLRVTASGRLLIRNICMVFDRHLPSARRRATFSSAI